MPKCFHATVLLLFFIFAGTGFLTGANSTHAGVSVYADDAIHGLTTTPPQFDTPDFHGIVSENPDNEPDTVPRRTRRPRPEEADTLPQRETPSRFIEDTLLLQQERPKEPQKTEKPPRSAIPWYTEEQLQQPFALTPNYVDTTLRGFQHYDFAARSGLFYAHKGNVGLAHKQLAFNLDMSPVLHIGQYDIYGDYIFRHDHLHYYRPNYVFTELKLVIGDEREQLFYAKHAQRLHETFHYGFQYRLINSPGPYSRHNARNANFYFTADYLSPNKRYQALGSLIINRTRNQESAGLADHELFEQQEVSTDVILQRAESWYRDVSVNLRHFYQLGIYVGGDTLSKGRFVNFGRINHDFTYERNAFIFLEEDPPYPFFNVPAIDTTATFDSTVVHRISNEISWSNFPLRSGRGSFPFNFKLYARHTLNTIQQPYFPEDKELVDTLGNPVYYYSKDRFGEIVQGVELQSDDTRFLSFGGYGHFTLGGYRDEDMHAGFFLNLGRRESKYRLTSKLRLANAEAPYFYNHFSGNYIRWENNFDKMQIANLQAKAQTPFVTLTGNYFLLNNMVYFNAQALPVQNSSTFSFLSLDILSDIEVGAFGFKNQVLLQHCTTQNFDNYPELTSYHSVYANFALSNRALINRAGIDVFYNMGYRAMAYMPVTRVFYNQQSYTTRDNLQVDVFWNAKIKSARLFVKYQNLLGLVFDTQPHYAIPFYPHAEAMFKFGVSWMFFD